MQSMTLKRRLIPTALVVSAVLASVVVGLNLMFAMLQGAPFQMTLKLLNGHTVAQFAQPDHNLVSEEFPVDLAIDTPQTIELRSDKISVPGVIVDFCDISLLPGRFQLRIGRSQFDVMRSRIAINGKDHSWRDR